MRHQLMILLISDHLEEQTRELVYHEIEGTGRHVDSANDAGEALLQLQSIHHPGFHPWPFEGCHCHRWTRASEYQYHSTIGHPTILERCPAYPERPVRTYFKKCRNSS